MAHSAYDSLLTPKCHIICQETLDYPDFHAKLKVGLAQDQKEGKHRLKRELEQLALAYGSQSMFPVARHLL